MADAPFPKLDKPILVPPGLTSMVLAKLDQAAGRDAARKAVTTGVLRPFDIAAADIAEPRPLWIPFWRVSLELPGLEIEGHKPRVSISVAARRAFPYPTRLPSALRRLGGETALDLAAVELVPFDTDILTGNGAVVVDADVDREDAVLAARAALIPNVGFGGRLVPEVESTTFVLYPVYHASYDYRGEARRDAADRDFFVAISGVTGEVLAATHPSAIRSLAAKVRRALSFDRRI